MLKRIMKKITFKRLKLKDDLFHPEAKSGMNNSVGGGGNDEHVILVLDKIEGYPMNQVGSPYVMDTTVEGGNTNLLVKDVALDASEIKDQLDMNDDVNVHL